MRIGVENKKSAYYRWLIPIDSLPVECYPRIKQYHLKGVDHYVCRFPEKEPTDTPPNKEIQ